MTKLVDTTEWREFRVRDLFEVRHGSRLNKSDRIDGEIPFVTAGFENRGVAQYIGNDVELYRNPITVDMFGNSFYQAGEVSGDDNVYFFIDDDVSGVSKQFIATSITAVCADRFDYGRQFRQGDADALRIKLPATSDGKPDWDYMEQYMTQVMDEMRPVAEELHSLDSKLKRHKFDTTEWKLFKVGDLFEVMRPTRSRSLKNYDDGNIRYVASGVGDVESECYKTEGASAKGVAAWLAPHDENDIDDGDCITISPVDGRAFYQDKDFLGRGGAGSSIIICRRKDGFMCDGSGEFVATVMTSIFSSWTYSSMGNTDLVLNSNIPLPVDLAGNPDWDYMSHTHTHTSARRCVLSRKCCSHSVDEV